MPTLPLYTPGEDPNGSHGVAAPGGYEFWRFEGASASGDVRFVATMGVGHPPPPAYLDRYARYRRRPTRYAPPAPSEYPCVHFAVYRAGELLAQFTDYFAGGQFSASPRHPQVLAGANAFTRAGDGATSLVLRGLSSGGGGVQTLSAQLTFRPLMACPALEVPLPASAPDADEHHWVVAAPLCEVSGVISATGAAKGNGRGAQDLDFRGRGFHDHGYGTGPQGLGLRRWARGTMLLHDRTVAFHFLEPVTPGASPTVRLVEAAAGVRELPAEPVATAWTDGRSGTIAYPRELRFHVPGSSPWVLHRPRVLEATRSYTRVRYSADVGNGSGEALVEAAATPRLLWRPAARIELPGTRAPGGAPTEAGGGTGSLAE